MRDVIFNKMNEPLTGIFERLIAGSMCLLFILYYYIKVLLKRNGYKIHLFFDYGKDYRRFKDMIEHEKNPKKKQKYINIQLMLKIFGASLVVSAILGVIFT